LGLRDSLFRRRNQSTRTVFNDKRSSFVPKWTSPPKRNSWEWVEYFSKSPRLAVVSRISMDLSSVPGKLFQVSPTGEETEILSHPFLDFIRKPNPLPEFSASAMFKLHQTYLELTGEAYMVIERDSFGIPRELWTVPQQWVLGTPYAGYPFYQVREPSGGILQISVDDMFVQKDVSPFDPYRRGAGHAESIADEIEVDEYAAKFQKRFFYNDATPAVIISMPNSTADQRERFLSVWNQRLRGAFNSHKSVAIDGNATVNSFGGNMRDLDMVAGREFLRNAVLEHWNVPREIMGITESSNRATSEAAQYIYAQNVLSPRLTAREEAINEQLVCEFGENLVYRFENIVPRNDEFLKQQALENFGAGLITKNIALEMQGLSSIGPAGDVYKGDVASTFYRAEDDPSKIYQPTQGQSPALTYGLKSKRLTPEPERVSPTRREANRARKQESTPGAQANAIPDDAETLRLLEQSMQQTETAFRREIQKYFAKEAQLLESALRNLPEPHLLSLNTFEQCLGLTQSLIDWEREKEILKNALMPLWQQGIEDGKRLAIDSFGVGKSSPRKTRECKDLFSDAWAQMQMSFLDVDSRVSLIVDTTQKQLAAQLHTGLLDGFNVEMLIRSCLDPVKDCTDRVDGIALNEAHTTTMFGKQGAFKAGGFDGKRWVTEGDDNVRATHRRANGQIRPIDEPFDVGGHKLMYPGDPMAPISETARCRCDFVPVRLANGGNGTM